MGRKPIMTDRLKIKPVSSVFDEEELRALDDWRRAQPDLPSRSEAIRRLVAAGVRKGKSK
jgi:hypothetical protein